ncbi:hypothetical protein [Amycolatopsis sp. NPDC004079]|uniref:hypothetical protein n=1 Tax=Amycolatopsis sp. NPDC004079 TaxID=3154549 RepID=UPI0033A8FA5B
MPTLADLDRELHTALHNDDAEAVKRLAEPLREHGLAALAHDLETRTPEQLRERVAVLTSLHDRA